MSVRVCVCACMCVCVCMHVCVHVLGGDVSVSVCMVHAQVRVGMYMHKQHVQRCEQVCIQLICH